VLILACVHDDSDKGCHAFTFCTSLLQLEIFLLKRSHLSLTNKFNTDNIPIMEYPDMD